jgi:UDP-N-acetyl-D-mannosaminuronate dehydrogenase
MLNHRLHVAHIPHRWYALEEKEHGVNQLRVVGGVCDCCLKAAVQFYGQINVNNNIYNIYNNYNNNGINNNSSSDYNNTDKINIESGNGNGNNSVFMDDSGIKIIPSTLDDAIALPSSFSTSSPAPMDTSSSSSSTTTIKNNDINYTPNLGIPLHPVSDIEIAELTKVAENAHRFLQIAFAEDIYLYCQASSINFPELREALNTKWNVEILEPKDGIGGHCLPKDTKMFLQSSTSVSTGNRILKASMEVDEEYKRYRLSRTSQTAANIQTSHRMGRTKSIQYD